MKQGYFKPFENVPKEIFMDLLREVSKKYKISKEDIFNCARKHYYGIMQERRSDGKIKGVNNFDPGHAAMLVFFRLDDYCLDVLAKRITLPPRKEIKEITKKKVYVRTPV